ncbi:hypothetical protein ABBQ38_004682 [Trebouxia sp. C0009 RCD-2024]
MPEHIVQYPNADEAAISGLQLNGDGPILFQVGKLTPGQYHQWVYSPRLGAPRFFQSTMLESISKTSWWYIPVIWGAVAAACLSYMHLHRTHSIVTTGFLLLCGVLGWQLTEYCIHRFLFHIEPSSYWGITLHFTFHGCHHKWPMDSLRLVFPPVPAVPIVSGVFYAMHQLLPKEAAMCISTGMLLGYIAYDCTHYFLHHSSSQTGILRGLKKAHISHHYKNHDAGYGISSRLFDSLLCTSAVHS